MTCFIWHASKDKQGYIDGIQYEYNTLYPRYKPVFTQVFPVEGKNVRRISFWQALRLCTQEPALTPEDIGVHTSELYTVRELAEEAKSRHWGPIAIFPEVCIIVRDQ